MDVQFYFGGTSLLIVVGVAMDTVQQVESQLIMRHYDGFMKKTPADSRPTLARRAAHDAVHVDHARPARGRQGHAGGAVRARTAASRKISTGDILRERGRRRTRRSAARPGRSWTAASW